MTSGGDEREGPVEDWFDDAGEPGGFRDPDAETWLEEPGRGPGGPRDRQPLLIAAAAAIVLLLLGVGIAWIVSGGDDDENAAATTTVTTTEQQTQPATTATTETATTPAVTGTVPEDVTLNEGDSGDEVMALQEALDALGYDVGEPDGVFGPATTEAVKQFQADAGIPADGVAGPQTIKAINDALAATG